MPDYKCQATPTITTSAYAFLLPMAYSFHSHLLFADSRPRSYAYVRRPVGSAGAHAARRCCGLTCAPTLLRLFSRHRRRRCETRARSWFMCVCDALTPPRQLRDPYRGLIAAADADKSYAIQSFARVRRGCGSHTHTHTRSARAVIPM